MSLLGACSQLRKILGTSQVLLAVTTLLPPLWLMDQPRWQGAPEDEHRPIFPHCSFLAAVGVLAYCFCFVSPTVAILCQTRNHSEPSTSSKHTSGSATLTCMLTTMVVNPKSFFSWAVFHGKSQLEVEVVGIGGHSRRQMMSCLLEQSSNSLIVVIELVVMLLGYKTQNLLTRAAQRHQGRCWAWIFCLEVLLQPAEGHHSHFACVLFQGVAVVASVSS